MLECMPLYCCIMSGSLVPLSRHRKSMHVSKSFNLQMPALLDVKSIKAEVRLIKSRSQSHTFVLLNLEEPTEPAELLEEGPVIRELVHWVATVAGWYGYTISSFALAFADGSLLCRLVSHLISYWRIMGC